MGCVFPVFPIQMSIVKPDPNNPCLTPITLVAVRIYSGVMGLEKIRTPNKKQFTLFSIPFYLLHRIEQLLDEVL